MLRMMESGVRIWLESDPITVLSFLLSSKFQLYSLILTVVELII